MITKNTTIVFKDGAQMRNKEIGGGIPLSKGESIMVHENGNILEYIVEDKHVECFMDGEDQEVNVTYVLKKKE